MSISQLGSFKRKRPVNILFLAAPTIFALFFKLQGHGNERTRSISNNEKGGVELALLTSFWAPKEPVPPHEIEVKAAILSNLLNPHFAEIHVLLEGTTQIYGCDEFTAELHSFLEPTAPASAAELKCTPWNGAQPTYYDLFTFSKQGLRDNLVILSNADMVFDESIATLRSLEPSSLVVIATSGLDQYRTPDRIRWYFENFTRLPLTHVVSRCYRDDTPRTSWDAYAFHPKSLEIFEMDFTDENSGEIFTMNRNGAENAALEAISRHSGLLQYSQICDHVKMWHFHTAAKMHKNEIGIKHNQLNPESCSSSLQHCLTPGHVNWTIRDVSDLT